MVQSWHILIEMLKNSGRHMPLQVIILIDAYILPFYHKSEIGLKMMIPTKFFFVSCFDDDDISVIKAIETSPKYKK